MSKLIQILILFSPVYHSINIQDLIRQRRDLNFKGYAENQFLHELNQNSIVPTVLEPITPDPGIQVRTINEPNAESKLIESLLVGRQSRQKSSRPVFNFLPTVSPPKCDEKYARTRKKFKT